MALGGVAVILSRRSLPMNGTVADGTGIEQGTYLKVADPNTYSASTGTNDVFGGFAYNEKIASDGNTKIAVLKGPGDEVRLTASGTITMGCALQTATPGNYVKAVTDLSDANIVGYALEAATAGETFRAVLLIQNHNAAAVGA